MRALNNIGFLRLVLASAVILGHAPEMTDGDRSRELLSWVSGYNITVAGLALDFFFLLSGFLITKSFQDSGSTLTFLKRRAARIVPGFVVAYLAAVFVLVPLTGGDCWYRLPNTLWRLLLLREPDVYPGQLEGVRYYPVLNGAVWTIFYEVRCYLLTVMLGVLGLLSRRRAVLLITCVALVCGILARNEAVLWRLHAVEMDPALQLVIGRLTAMARFAGIYLVGSCFRLYWAEISRFLTTRTAALCLLAAVLLMYCVPFLTEPAWSTCGAAWLFWLAMKADLGPLQRINDRWDLSYGTYLYGWPAAMLFLWLEPTMAPEVLAPLALGLALALGALSWWGVEKPVLTLVRPARPAARPGLLPDVEPQRSPAA